MNHEMEASSLHLLRTAICSRCTECGACVRDCAFLRRYGTPKAIAAGLEAGDPGRMGIASRCSLCGLCAVVCPEGLDPAGFFLALRRHQVASGVFTALPYLGLLTHERLGRSSLLSWHGLPPGCETVFFPGCGLPGSRPRATLALFEHLRRLVPNLGMVLDCCIKPSHDLGRETHFDTVFEALRTRLKERGISTVLTACPNCTKVFRWYGKELAVQTVWEVLHAGDPGGWERRGGGVEVSVHDPCPLRDDQPSQEAVRGLLADSGYALVEMRHRGRRTICCGEGGAVAHIDPGLAGEWTLLRGREAGGRLLVASCSGCVAMLNRSTPTVHLLDLLLPAEAALDKAAGRPFAANTWQRRFFLKRKVVRLSQERR